MVNLHFVHGCVPFDVSGRADDFLCTLSQLVREVLSGSHISLFKLVQLHAVTDKQVVGDSSLVELDVVFEVLVLFFVEQVLLGSLWDVVVEQRVAFVEFSLVLRDTSAIFFLLK